MDNILGLSPYQRYSLLLLYSVTKVAAGSVYRAATEAVNTLTPLDISHQTVGRMVRTVGDKYAQYEEAQTIRLSAARNRWKSRNTCSLKATVS